MRYMINVPYFAEPDKVNSRNVLHKFVERIPRFELLVSTLERRLSFTSLQRHFFSDQ